MKSFKNKVLVGEYVVAAGEIFCFYLCRGIKRPDNMTPKAFKARFKVLMKLYDDLDAKFELTICNWEMKFIGFNAFFLVNWNKFVAQQKDYLKLSMGNFITYFQILHAQESPHCKHWKCNTKENWTVRKQTKRRCCMLSINLLPTSKRLPATLINLQNKCPIEFLLPL